MISNCIKSALFLAVLAGVSACSSSSSSSSDATSVDISAAPVPANVVMMAAGPKMFTAVSTNTEIVLNKAFLVFTSVTIETSCDASFSAALEGMLDLIIPQAQAHTEATPTSTGTPYVVDVLAVDGGDISLGELSPPTGDYCGAEIDLQAADDDAVNLPAGTDMVGKTVYIEGTYDTGSGAVLFTFSNSFNLSRKLSLSSLMMIDSGNTDGTVAMAINYDTWFDGVDMADLVGGNTDQVNAALKNITDSIHQK